jgi:hypothetical protein
LLASHLGTEINLLSGVFLLQLLAKRSFLVLVGVIEFEFDVTEKVCLGETELLERVFVCLLRHGIFKLFKFLLVDFEILLDSVGLIMLLI